jgi:hypothetical protein
MKLKDIQYVHCTLFHSDVHALVQQDFQQIFNVLYFVLITQAKPSQREGKTKRAERKGGSHYACVCSQGNLGGGAGSTLTNKRCLLYKSRVA